MVGGLLTVATPPLEDIQSHQQPPVRADRCEQRRDRTVPGVWHHSQADPTRAAFPTGHPVVSSKTPEASAKTHTHNWCGRQRQAANTTQRFEAQRLLASLGGVRDCSAVPLRYTHRSPSLNPQGDPRKWAKTWGQTRATPAAGGVPKTQSKNANKIPEARVKCTENIRYDSSQRKEQIKDTVITQRTVEWCRESQVDHPNHDPIAPSGSRDR